VIAAPPVVPAFVQHVVERRAGALAYVPARTPADYRYLSYSWDATRHVLTIRLHHKNYVASNARRTVSVTVRWFHGTLARCGDGNEKSYQVGGNRVFSTGGTFAWRCVRGAGGRIVELAAGGVTIPASTLAIVASSVHRV
jgi:hypothetical protein